MRTFDKAAVHETEMIAARIDRLPFSRWHARVSSVIGTAHLFDAYDALTIAFVMPLLVRQWSLTPLGTGLAISAGYVGQMIGALLLSNLAQRWGRIPALRCSLLILSLFSFASIFVWSLWIFIIIRFIQGIGLGGETPIAATYINEIVPGRLRGKVVFALQMLFALGLLVAALLAVQLIPRFGWQAMYLVGALPIILAIALPKLIPESPRWLAEQARGKEAQDILARVEAQAGVIQAPQPPQPLVQPGKAIDRSPLTKELGPSALLSAHFRKRTLVVWVLALCASTTGYGIANWMPTLFTTIYGLSLHQALQYGLSSNIAGFFAALTAIFLIDGIGRRRTFMASFAGAAALLLVIRFTTAGSDPWLVMLLSAFSFGLMGIVIGGSYVYAPEIYPTQLRAIGAGSASACLRLGSIISPFVVGLLLPAFGVGSVFIFFAGSAILGAATMYLFGVETKGRSLEAIEDLF